jgi:hypothetical protein
MNQLVNNDVMNRVNACHLMLNCRILDLSYCDNISAFGQGGSNGWKDMFTCPYTIHIYEMNISHTNITDIDVENLADSYFFPNLKILYLNNSLAKEKFTFQSIIKLIKSQRFSSDFDAVGLIRQN